MVYETEFRIASARTFLEETEHALAHSRQIRIDALGSETAQEWDPEDYGYERQVVERTFDEDLPVVLAHSFVSHLQSLFETRLYALAQYLEARKSPSASLSALKGTAIERAKIFLAEFGEPIAADPAWQTLMDLGDIRNAIAHRGGVVESTGRDRSLVSRLKSRYGGGVRVELRPLGDGNVLILELAVCYSLLTDISTFFDRAFQNFRLGKYSPK